MTAKDHVVLLGDSTIDNVCWTNHPHEVPEQLRTLLPEAFVTNLAADGFTSSDLLHGAVPAISWRKRSEVGDPFPKCSEGGRFAPLRVLQSLEPKPTHAVLSIGGNDIREILSNMDQLPYVIDDFRRNYAAILEELCRSVPNVILMFQYRPSFAMDAGGYGVYRAIGSLPGPGDAVSKLNQLMATIYQPVINEARRRRLAIVDLPRTFDIHNDELYCCQIEPSAKGGTLIATLLSYVFKSHDFTGPSMLHLIHDGAPRTEANDECLNWSIPHDASDEEVLLQGQTSRRPSASSGYFREHARFAYGRASFPHR